MNKTIFFLRIILWLSLAIFIGWLIRQMVVPSGQVTYLFDNKHRSDFIGQLEPTNQVLVVDGRIRLLGDKTYFKLRTPRPFNKLKLTLRFKPENQPLLEVGLLVKDRSGEHYEVKPLYNQLINQLYRSQEWGVLETGPTMLLQRQEAFNSLSQFFAKLPDTKLIAVYHYPPMSQQTRIIDANFLLSPQTDYIVANYQLPETTAGDLYQARVEFNLSGVVRHQDNYELMISLPGLNNKLESGGGVDVEMIKAEFFGITWREFFKL